MLMGAEFHPFPAGFWVRIEYTLAVGETEAYAYELFTGAPPIAIRVSEVMLIRGPEVISNFGQHVEPQVSSRAGIWELYAFHVGQGMCALLHNQTCGFLFDSGAGTPIKRPNYQAGTTSSGAPMRNDLETRSRGKKLQMILSHPDSDHWRLLDWDAALCASLTHIFKPSGTPSLPFTSTHIKPRVYDLFGTTTVVEGAKTLFKSHRSQPRVSDRNGECLVTEVWLNGTSLLSGDYVYDRMGLDSEPAIVSLAAATLRAVVVPHHGDKASASVTVRAGTLRASPAFFSAGNHTGYGHPTPQSLAAHRAASFKNLQNTTSEDILEEQLA